MVIPDWAVAKFWRCVVFPDDEDGCWNWNGSKNPGGYSICAGPRKDRHLFTKAAHVSLILHGHPRPPPPSHFALHGDCSNRECVNPNHLRWGTAAENMADKVRLKRENVPVGSKHPFARFSEEDIISIRKDPRPQAEIAASFGIAQGSVSRIKNKTVWKHLDSDVVLFRCGRPAHRK